MRPRPGRILRSDVCARRRDPLAAPPAYVRSWMWRDLPGRVDQRSTGLCRPVRHVLRPMDGPGRRVPAGTVSANPGGAAWLPLLPAALLRPLVPDLSASWVVRGGLSPSVWQLRRSRMRRLRWHAVYPGLSAWCRHSLPGPRDAFFGLAGVGAGAGRPTERDEYPGRELGHSSLPSRAGQTDP